jgi:spermidine/putrescine transport system substrate-binding protein
VLAKFSKDQLAAMQYDTLEERVSKAVEFDIVPQYDKLLDIYTAARRARG